MGLFPLGVRRADESVSPLGALLSPGGGGGGGGCHPGVRPCPWGRGSRDVEVRSSALALGAAAAFTGASLVAFLIWR